MSQIDLTPAEKLAIAYARVFGRNDESRSEAQKLVWADMEKRGYVRRSTAVPLANGEVQTMKMEIAEGCRIFHLDTMMQIERAKTPEEKTKPKSKR